MGQDMEALTMHQHHTEEVFTKSVFDISCFVVFLSLCCSPKVISFVVFYTDSCMEFKCQTPCQGKVFLSLYSSPKWGLFWTILSCSMRSKDCLENGHLL